MANSNTFGGFQNLPAQTITSSSEVGYKVPASGFYSTLPSPSQVAGNILVVPALAGDVTSGGVLDGRPFKVRVNGVINSAQSENMTVAIYQCTAAQFAAGFTSATTGTKVATTATQATGAALKSNFFLDYTGLWDSQSKTLNGVLTYHSFALTYGAFATATAQVTSLNENDLNFYVTFTFGTGTGDVVGPIDFVVERA